MKPKRSIWKDMREGLYVLIALFILVGAVGGIRAFSYKPPDAFNERVDNFVKEYVGLVFTFEKEAKDGRLEALKKQSTNYVEILSPEIGISVITGIEVKDKLKLETGEHATLYEYVTVVNYAYRIENTTETIQDVVTFKLHIIEDNLVGSFLMKTMTPFDFDYQYGLTDSAKKEIEGKDSEKRKLSGNGLEKNEQGVYLDQIKLFFGAYNQSLASAQSLVGSDVRLSVLTGQFLIESIKIDQATKTTDGLVHLIVSVEYKTKDQAMHFKKQYKLEIKEKTITKMEEL